jgi:hypothetical protein
MGIGYSCIDIDDNASAVIGPLLAEGINKVIRYIAPGRINESWGVATAAAGRQHASPSSLTEVEFP